MKLICRLYLPGEGNLKLFGVEAADWNEASSALDLQTEREVQDADYVYCMDHGRVAEEGTPMSYWQGKACIMRCTDCKVRIDSLSGCMGTC